MKENNILNIPRFFVFLIISGLIIAILEASNDSLKKTDVVFHNIKCKDVSKLMFFMNKQSNFCRFCADSSDLKSISDSTTDIQISTGMKIIGSEREDGCEFSIVKIFEYDLNNDGIDEIFISRHNPYLQWPHINLLDVSNEDQIMLIYGENLKGKASYSILNQRTNGYFDLLLQGVNINIILQFDGKSYKLKIFENKD